MTAVEPGFFVYHIDQRDRIASVDDAWRAFAVENGAPQLAGDAVIGQLLLSYITDAETSHLYQVLLQKLRKTGVPIRVPFRCDAPALRRFMELEMAADDAGGVRFTGRLLRLERRAPVNLLDPALQRGESLLRMCSWCKRIDVGGGVWLEVEDAIARLHLFDAAPLPQISHGMCDACFALLYPPGEEE